MICVTFINSTIEQFLLLHTEVKLIELRLDRIKLNNEDLKRYCVLPLGIIATCRKSPNMKESQRMEILKMAIDFGATYVDMDVENDQDMIAEVKKYALDHHCRLITSYHNFKNTPKISKLENIIYRCINEHADIVKIATLVQQEEDIEVLKSLYGKAKNIIAIGMGEKGVITRVKACEWGAPFTYAAACDEEIAAPGQLSYNVLLQYLKD